MARFAVATHDSPDAPTFEIHMLGCGHLSRRYWYEADGEPEEIIRAIITSDPRAEWKPTDFLVAPCVRRKRGTSAVHGGE